MALFGVITTDEAIFAGDKTRIDVGQSFVTPDEDQSYTLEVKALDEVEYISVTGKKYLDWLYLNPGTETISLKIAAGAKSETFLREITVLDASTLKLFSTDPDLIPYEPSILDKLPSKWSSYNLIHYRVQKQILKWLAEKGIVSTDGSVITAEQVLDVNEVKELSVYMVLAIIFEGAQNQVGDIFSEKSKEYAAKASEKSQAAILRLDVSKTATATPIDNFSSRLVRG